MARRFAVTAALGLLAPTAAAAVVLPPVTTELPAPDAVPSRVAFSDGERGLGSAALFVSSAGDDYVTIGSFAPVPGAEGDRERSSVGAAVFVVGTPLESEISAFISTRDAATGDVYVTVDPLADGWDSITTRITCDGALHSHPVVSPDGEWVAYATYDPEVTADGGGWDIRVVQIAEPACDDGEPFPGAERRVTSGPGDNLWPAWIQGSEGLGEIVFSSTREDPLGDLYVVSLDAEDPVPLRLTTDPGADVQPTVLTSDEYGAEFVVFSTTRFRADGSVGIARLDPPDAPDGPEPVEVMDPWALAGLPTPQGSEPAVRGAAGQDFAGLYGLAFTSTDSDPHGDIWTGPLFWNNESAVPDLFGVPLPVPGAGVAESHPSFDGDPGVTPGGTLDVIATRDAPGDVSDVVAADGSDLRLAAATEITIDGEQVAADDAEASYSPDGSQLVFSAEVVSEENGQIGRRLMVAEADGTGVLPLDYPWDPGQVEFFPPDVDISPAWSPDGNRIAFVRLVPSSDPASTRASGEVMVVDLRTPEAEPLLVSGPSEVPSDADPSWSPDGAWLAVHTGDPTSEGSPGRLAVLDATGDLTRGGFVTMPAPGCTEEECPPVEISGADPAWSPDGTAIAVTSLATVAPPSDDGGGTAALVAPPDLPADGVDSPGAISLVHVDPAGPTTALGLTAVTGVGFDGTPTPTYGTLARATDAAWSPDGAELYLTGQRRGVAGDWDVYAVQSDGTGLREVATGPAAQTEPTAQPAADLQLTLTVSPEAVEVGAPAQVTATVANVGSGLVRNASVIIELPPGLELFGDPPADCLLVPPFLTCVPGDVLPTGGSATFVFSVTGPEAGTFEISSVVIRGPGGSVDNDVSDNTATATLVITPGGTGDVAVTMALSADTVWVGGTGSVATITVTNLGGADATGVLLAMTYPAAVTATGPAPCLVATATCDLGVLAPGAAATVTLQTTLGALGEDVLGSDPSGEWPILANVTSSGVDPRPGNNSAAVNLRVLQPEIRVLPAVARPGDPVLAFGEDFPPGDEVTLVWSAGITPVPGPYEVGPDGQLRVPLVIVSRDQLGDRLLTATSATGAFSPIEGDLLVVPRSIQAPTFISRG